MPSIAGKISKFTKCEIDYLFQHARSVFKDQSCTILMAPRQKEFGRILIITSRKVGNAPQRNLIRRRIKSIVYEEKLFNCNVDCAVIVYKKAITLSFEELKIIIISAYKKGGKNNESSLF